MKLNKWREIPEDKKGHLTMGAIVGALSYIIIIVGRFSPVDAIIGSTIAVSIVGFIKEVRDSTGKGDPDWMDAIATIAGGVYGTMLGLLLMKLIS